MCCNSGESGTTLPDNSVLRSRALARQIFKTNSIDKLISEVGTAAAPAPKSLGPVSLTALGIGAALSAAWHPYDHQGLRSAATLPLRSSFRTRRWST